jgi:hypothetical protein
MKPLSQSDQRGGAMFGIVVSMASILVVCLSSIEMQSMICFCISCTAMQSMMQLASVSNPEFSKRYRWLLYFFVLAPIVCSVVYLFRERSRILQGYDSFLYGLIPVAVFVIGYAWYFKTHGIEVPPVPSDTLCDTGKEAITKNCS